jgi:arylsulfatase A-like enzyme/type 1 glutamine amidotransferase
MRRLIDIPWRRLGILLVLSAGLPVALSAKPLRAIILTGDNNHHWQSTTPVLEEILEQGGRFEVQVVTDPESLTGGLLERCDVLVSNWNNWTSRHQGQPPAVPWSEVLKSAYLGFVAGGGGHVTVHAGASSFYDWEEYQRIGLASWKIGDTGHGPVHKFQVRISDPAHPVTVGLESSATEDELWYRPGIQPDARILAEAWSEPTQTWEPTALTGAFGQGRCFALLLGHNATTMSNAGFRRLFFRGTEWAATGRVGWSSFQYDQSPGHLALLMDGRELWRLNFSRDLPKPYFHPLRTPKGQDLTWVGPKDHPWHLGLWFSWKKINGVNYWEFEKGKSLPVGRTVIEAVEILEANEKAARVRLDMTLHPGEGKDPVARETLWLRIETPRADGTYAIDWRQRTEALEDLVFGRSSGYGGLSFRAGQQWRNPLIRNSEGKGGLENTHLQRARWLDFSGTVNGEPLGLTLFDHPGNSRHPTPWFVVEKILGQKDGPWHPFFYGNAALLGAEPLSLPRGGALELSYRALVHSELPDSAALEAEFAAFSQAKPETGRSRTIRPNIVFIMADDHNRQSIGAYGGRYREVAPTPAIDRLAAEGMIFHAMMTPNSVCVPARAALITGKYSHLNGVKTNADAFDGSQQTFPKLLQEAGYRTAVFGKWHLKSQPNGFDHYAVLPGQGRFYDPPMLETGKAWNPAGAEVFRGYTTDIITDKSIEWIRAQPADKPFCVLVHHKAPHVPHHPAPGDENFLEGITLPEPENLLDDYKGRAIGEVRDTASFSRLLINREGHYRRMVERFEGRREEGTRAIYQEFFKGYLRLVKSLDENVGRLIDHLDAAGLSDNTIIIYTSDNGFFNGEHGLYNKMWMYEESLHLPLLVRWPGVVKPGSESRQLASLLDIAPTFLDLARGDQLSPHGQRQK